jgi:hypothetical protein
MAFQSTPAPPLRDKMGSVCKATLEIDNIELVIEWLLFIRGEYGPCETVPGPDA